MKLAGKSCRIGEKKKKKLHKLDSAGIDRGWAPTEPMLPWQRDN